RENSQRTSVVTEGGSPRSGSVEGAGSVNSFLKKLELSDVYYKFSEKNTLIYLAFADGKLFSVEENIPAINWKIVAEVKEIKGFSCQKAMGSFKGRSYEAWFCDKIPYSNGPWKLGGLPGLIIEAYDSKKEVVFKFGSIEYEKSDGAKVTLALPTDLIKTTPKKYAEYQAAVLRNTDATKSTLPPGVKKMDDTFNGDGKLVKKREMNNPIEKK
ncbi:MAG: GLPGLI family protein, partial [Sediminibacterium sp.]